MPVQSSEVKEEHLPELDDEFAKSLGHDLETMDQFREKTAGNLKATADSEARVEGEVDRMARHQAMVLGEWILRST